MLATPSTTPFDRPGWLFELKYDGFRVLGIHEGDRCACSRGAVTTYRPASRRSWPVACLQELPNIVLDGELVVLDDQGKPQFERLRRRARLKKQGSVEQAARIEPAAVFAFDLLELRGKDMRSLPLPEAQEGPPERATTLAARSCG